MEKKRIVLRYELQLPEEGGSLFIPLCAVTDEGEIKSLPIEGVNGGTV